MGLREGEMGKMGEGDKSHRPTRAEDTQRWPRGHRKWSAFEPEQEPDQPGKHFAVVFASVCLSTITKHHRTGG